MSRYLLTNAAIVTGTSSFRGSLGIDGDVIAGIWHGEVPSFPDAEVIDLGGKVLMAGGIDAHVHFREPGMTAKGDIASESEAALLGGVTSFIDMPNTVPPAVTLESLEDKLGRAEATSLINYGFHIGATNTNPELIEGYLSEGQGGKFAGIKVFLGSSTGRMLVDDDSALGKIFMMKGKTVLVHCEDEALIRAGLEAARSAYGDSIPFSLHPRIRSREVCVRSTAKALDLATRYGTALHILHVSTADEVEMIRAAKSVNPRITAETSANYLWFCDEDYDRLGGRVKCNPAIKTARDRDALREALADGTIDTIGSDHAPHLPEEKGKPYLLCPSGIPSIRESLSVAVTVALGCGIPLTRIASAFSERAAGIFGIKERGLLKPGFKADLTVIDPEASFKVGKGAGKCGWSPYEGATLKGAMDKVWVNGSLTVDGGKVRLRKDLYRQSPLTFI